jgi:hypothetical protein
MPAGWIGLYAGRYNLDGSFDGAPVNIQNPLWDDFTFFIGDNYQSHEFNDFVGSQPFNVDRDHWYALWVWWEGTSLPMDIHQTLNSVARRTRKLSAMCHLLVGILYIIILQIS